MLHMLHCPIAGHAVTDPATSERHIIIHHDGSMPIALGAGISLPARCAGHAWSERSCEG